jgi:hypothetical protein
VDGCRLLTLLIAFLHHSFPDFEVITKFDIKNCTNTSYGRGQSKGIAERGGKSRYIS